MSEQEKTFAQGIIFKKPTDKAPDFVKGSLSIKVDEAVPFLQEKANNGWVNLDLKLSKGGKLYLELNDWKPTNTQQSTEKPTQGQIEGNTDELGEDLNPEDIPFD